MHGWPLRRAAAQHWISGQMSGKDRL